jgi:hypothetical protein
MHRTQQMHDVERCGHPGEYRDQSRQRRIVHEIRGQAHDKPSQQQADSGLSDGMGPALWLLLPPGFGFAFTK